MTTRPSAAESEPDDKATEELLDRMREFAVDLGVEFLGRALSFARREQERMAMELYHGERRAGALRAKLGVAAPGHHAELRQNPCLRCTRAEANAGEIKILEAQVQCEKKH